jgi:hypothetical protein
MLFGFSKLIVPTAKVCPPRLTPGLGGVEEGSRLLTYNNSSMLMVAFAARLMLHVKAAPATNAEGAPPRTKTALIDRRHGRKFSRKSARCIARVTAKGLAGGKGASFVQDSTAKAHKLVRSIQQLKPDFLQILGL